MYAITEVPKVDAAATSLAQNMVIPSEGEFFLRTQQTAKWKPPSEGILKLLPPPSEYPSQPHFSDKYSVLSGGH